MRDSICGSVALLSAFLPLSDLYPQADVADVPSQEIKLPARKGTRKGAPERSFFLIGPERSDNTPEKGYGLVLVLPGGPGTRDFHPFVKRIYKNALGEDWMAAQLIAPAWARSKEIVWPTRANAPKGLETELFVEDVVTHVARRRKLDPSRVLLLTWSSGGPAAYAISLAKRKSVTGFFVAMSVFKPNELPPLREARGEAYYLLHSPEDPVCPYRMAEDAKERLSKAGARVALRTYSGGHGWKGDVYGSLREGFSWLKKHRAPADRQMWPKSRRRPR